MRVSLERYSRKDNNFYYTDDCPYYDWVLGFSRCPDEELQGEDQVLKLIRSVRKGEMDIMSHGFFH